MIRQDGRARREALEAVGLVALTTLACLPLRGRLQTTDVAMLYLLAVVAVASRSRQGAALLASVLSIAAFDFVFVPPYSTFTVSNAAYILTFGVMLAVAVIMSRLTSRIREQADAAGERERRTAALYAMSQEIAADNGRGPAAVIERHAAGVTGGAALLVVVDESAGESFEWPADGLLGDLATRVAARLAHERGRPAGSGTHCCAEAEALCVPVRTPSRALGVLVVGPGSPGREIDAAERRTVEALAEQAAAALDRSLLAERHEAERLRTALLSSLSHDLRTPLGTIQGAASSLLHDASTLTSDTRRVLSETIIEESHRMSRLVANLLDMVRVETESLAVRKEWQPLEEALGVALLRLEDRLRAHPVTTRLPDDLPLVPIDGLLVEQLFINLLENAAKHTPPGTAIHVSAWVEQAAVVVEVADSGPGVRAGAEEAVFRKFYRASGSEHSGGAGLGLTICRGIVAAHGGKIWLAPTPAGAAFRFTLPLDGPPMDALPVEPADG